MAPILVKITNKFSCTPPLNSLDTGRSAARIRVMKLAKHEDLTLAERASLNLFYPWMLAAADIAYGLYQQSEDYARFCKYKDWNFAAMKYLETSLHEEYMKMAWKKKWFTILFFPWTVLPSKELREIYIELINNEK